MKIGNINEQAFLKNNNLIINKEKSKELTKNKPSIKKKHIKSEIKVNKALEEIEKNHNYSWAEEVYNRNKDELDKPMTYYRGYEQSGQKVFNDANKFANTLDYLGIKKGDEILLCMSNTPELLKILLGASRQGVIVNLISPSFDKDFIKETIEKSGKKLFIATDDKYAEIESLINKMTVKNKVIVSLTDSLESSIYPYKEYDDKFYPFRNRVDDFKKSDESILTFSEFLNIGKMHSAKKADVKLDDPFTITYTSGSTGWPKAIIHSSRPYITIARFHDPDLSRMPAMRNMRGHAHLPTTSNTNIASSISDTLCQKCTVAFEPIYDINFYPYSLLINQPGFSNATRSFLVNMVKAFDEDPLLIGHKLPFAINYVAVGEDISKNEEEFINRGLKKLEAGSKALPKPLSPIKVSVGGGNCEQGGLYFTLFKNLREKLSINKDQRYDFGLIPFQMTNFAILRDDLTECDYNELGLLVATSPCNMVKYRDNEEATKNYYITDAYGRVWGNTNIYSYVNKNGNVVLKGRKDSVTKLDDGTKIPNFLIAKALQDHIKEILSCEVVTVNYNGTDFFVAHYERLPHADTIYEKLADVSKEIFMKEIYDKLLFEEHSKNNLYPLTSSGKRDVKALVEKGISKKSVKPFPRGISEVLLYKGKYYANKYIEEIAKEKINKKTQKLLYK